MKNSAKFIVIAIFGVFVLGLVLNKAGAASMSQRNSASATPTPAAANSKPANTAANMAVNPAGNMAANMATNTTPAKPAGGGKTIPKSFTLGKDSLSEYGEVAFNHDKHAFEKYSPDGTSVMACTECHHTDQPKASLKAPDVTSERSVALTMDVFQTSTQAVTECRACHFQEGNVPDGKTMPSITEGGKSKDMTNQNAYHLNCNTCHDAAFKARPELKKRPGFATSKDCTVCHKSN